jgi:AcrR family transcriptional regulator
VKPSKTTNSQDATGAKRWVRRREARPGEIVEAALACFNERGFAATKLDDVAKRAGVTKGTLYLYFASKEDLFKAAVRESLLPRIVQLLGGMTGELEDPAKTIRRFMLSFVQEVLPTPAGIIPKLIISEAHNFPELARFYHDEVIKRVRSLLTDLIRRGVEEGRFRPVDPELVFFSLVSPMMIAALWRQTFEAYDTHPLDASAMISSHLDLIFRGLAPDEGDPPSSKTRPGGTARAAGPEAGPVPAGRKARQP